jgi:cytidine deaminase
MTHRQIDDRDRELIDAARRAIEGQYRPGRTRTAREVGAALRTASGDVYTGVNLTTDTPRASVCAEPVAIGAAITDGEESFETVVAVLYEPGDNPEYDGDPDAAPEYRIISACGVCRELIRDYDPDTDVILHGESHGSDEPVKVPVTDLLPGLSWRDGGPP